MAQKSAQDMFAIQYGDKETIQIHKNEPIITRSLTGFFEWIYKIILYTAEQEGDIHIEATLCPMYHSQEECTDIRFNSPSKEIKQKRVYVHLDAHASHLTIPSLENNIKTVQLILHTNENVRIKQIGGRVCYLKDQPTTD